MATSKVTPDAEAFVSEIHIAPSPERVFQALELDPPRLLFHTWAASWSGEVENYRPLGIGTYERRYFG
jgi:uncharacterized protein YndB with AHSA1/START domain